MDDNTGFVLIALVIAAAFLVYRLGTTWLLRDGADRRDLRSLTSRIADLEERHERTTSKHANRLRRVERRASEGRTLALQVAQNEAQRTEDYARLRDDIDGLIDASAEDQARINYIGGVAGQAQVNASASHTLAVEALRASRRPCAIINPTAEA